jgi:hypothetical protein
MKWNIPGRFRPLLFLAAIEDGTRADAIAGLQTTRAAARAKRAGCERKVDHNDPQDAKDHFREKGGKSARPGATHRSAYLKPTTPDSTEQRGALGHGAGPQELQQGRSVEARQHDAEAPLQSHLVEHLRRRDAGSEGGAGHSRASWQLTRCGTPALNSFRT